MEYAQEGRRGFTGSWQQVSVGSGFLLGSLSAALLSSSLSPEAFISWGWRVPFLLGILVGILGAYLRWRLSDTPKFTEIEQHGEVTKTPLIETLTRYRRETLTIFGLTLHNTVAYYIPIIYMTSYIVSVTKLAPSSALWIGTSCLLVFVILIPIWGALSDRIGRKPLLLLSSGGYIILAYPLFMMASSGSATLALIAQMVMIVFLSFFSGPCPAAYSEILPTRVRYTALSIGYNIAVALFGGFAPFIATWLIGVTGSNLAPSYYLIAAATITFLVVLKNPRDGVRAVALTGSPAGPGGHRSCPVFSAGGCAGSCRPENHRRNGSSFEEDDNDVHTIGTIDWLLRRVGHLSGARFARSRNIPAGHWYGRN